MNLDISINSQNQTNIHFNNLVKLQRTSHDQKTQKVAVWKGNGTPLIQEVGEILFGHT